jgi:putative spermidine/putrescine transport system substrate-binding protein
MSSKTKDESGTAAARRSFLKGSLATAALASPLMNPAKAAETVYVNTWGGRWEEGARTHLFNPFTQETGIDVRTVSPVSFAKLAAQVRTGVYEFDVTTLGLAELARADAAGLIEKFDTSGIDMSTLWPGAVTLNGVASHGFANMIVYRKDKYPNGGPQNWQQFWDVQKFPGDRSLQRYAARAVAFALMADGVDPKKLFPYDLDRAFKSLDRIKPHVRVWWNQGPQSAQIIRDAQAHMIGMWSIEAAPLVEQKVPVEPVWNQAVVDVAVWVVAKGSPRAKNAWKFIQSAVKAERVGKFAQHIASGPMNPKAFDFLPPAIGRAMPTHPDNLKNAIVIDAVKLQPQLDELNKRFDTWVTS